MVELANVRGVRDYWPEEQLTNQRIVDAIRRKFELYGFKPAETPILNNFELLSSKYAGGAEILKETFKVQRPKFEETEKASGREIALRYDLTVPLAKLIGSNPKVKMPFKRFEIGKVFRDGPTKVGRYKEFTQCDADIIGSRSVLADAECIALAFEAFQELELKVKAKVNNRKLLSGILEECDVEEKLRNSAILSIDKLEKIGLDSVRKELTGLGLKSQSIDDVFELISVEGTPEEIIDKLEGKGSNNSFKEGIEELKRLLEALNSMNSLKGVEVDLSLARGLDIYTGTVFEFFAEDSKITSSVVGGGRYDKIIGAFLESKEEYPAVGVSFGLDVIFEVLKEKGLGAKKSNTRVFIAAIQTENECLELAAQLRKEGISTEVDLMNRNISKNLDYANTEGIPFMVIAGKKELESGKLTFKDMKSGVQEALTLEEVIKRVKAS